MHPVLITRLEATKRLSGPAASLHAPTAWAAAPTPVLTPSVPPRRPPRAFKFYRHIGWGSVPQMRADRRGSASACCCIDGEVPRPPVATSVAAAPGPASWPSGATSLVGATPRAWGGVRGLLVPGGGATP
ncbi:hypothetical protein VTO73DRAFT_1604 [Trametes versicolor]